MTAVYGIHFLFSLRNTFLSNDRKHLFCFPVVNAPHDENTRSTNASDDGVAKISISKGGSSYFRLGRLSRFNFDEDIL